MTELSRRSFLAGTGAVGTGIVVSGSVAALLGSAPAALAAPTAQGYGPLVEDPAGILDLPQGFRYRMFSRSAGWPELDRPPCGTTRPVGRHDHGRGRAGQHHRVAVRRLPLRGR